MEGDGHIHKENKNGINVNNGMKILDEAEKKRL